MHACFCPAHQCYQGQLTLRNNTPDKATKHWLAFYSTVNQWELLCFGSLLQASTVASYTRVWDAVFGDKQCGLGVHA